MNKKLEQSLIVFCVMMLAIFLGVCFVEGVRNNQNQLEQKWFDDCIMDLRNEYNTSLEDTEMYCQYLFGKEKYEQGGKQ